MGFSAAGGALRWGSTASWLEHATWFCMSLRSLLSSVAARRVVRSAARHGSEARPAVVVDVGAGVADAKGSANSLDDLGPSWASNSSRSWREVMTPTHTLAALYSLASSASLSCSSCCASLTLGSLLPSCLPFSLSSLFLSDSRCRLRSDSPTRPSCLTSGLSSCSCRKASPKLWPTPNTSGLLAVASSPPADADARLTLLRLLACSTLSA
mmetsp:Transcript_33882/g.97630  ORF Transcript_33882/g.97630 Transcript_33882/m.97630 type:complete len:211 (-) Transcript_33882:155-787(-)